MVEMFGCDGACTEFVELIEAVEPELLDGETENAAAAA